MAFRTSSRCCYCAVYQRRSFCSCQNLQNQIVERRSYPRAPGQTTSTKSPSGPRNWTTLSIASFIDWIKLCRVHDNLLLKLAHLTLAVLIADCIAFVLRTKTEQGP